MTGTSARIFVAIGLCMIATAASAAAAAPGRQPAAARRVAVLPDVRRVDAVKALAGRPGELLICTENVGAFCGGGTPATMWKLVLDPATGAAGSLDRVQSLDQVQQVRQSILQASDGTLFTGGGWGGFTPPYYSTDGGKTWRPSRKGACPPNSTFCLAEFKGKVYAGTGYEPHHAEVYRWLGEGRWERVLEMQPPRSIFSTMAVFRDCLFVGSVIYWANAQPIGAPVCIAVEGEFLAATEGIPQTHNVDALLAGGDSLYALTTGPAGREFFRFTGSRWEPWCKFAIETGGRPVMSAGGTIYVAGKRNARQGVFASRNGGRAWEEVAALDSPELFSMDLRGDRLYVGTVADADNKGYVYQVDVSAWEQPNAGARTESALAVELTAKPQKTGVCVTIAYANRSDSPVTLFEYMTPEWHVAKWFRIAIDGQPWEPPPLAFAGVHPGHTRIIKPGERSDMTSLVFQSPRAPMAPWLDEQTRLRPGRHTLTVQPRAERLVPMIAPPKAASIEFTVMGSSVTTEPGAALTRTAPDGKPATEPDLARPAGLAGISISTPTGWWLSIDKDGGGGLGWGVFTRYGDFRPLPAGLLDFQEVCKGLAGSVRPKGRLEQDCGILVVREDGAIFDLYARDDPAMLGLFEKALKSSAPVYHDRFDEIRRSHPIIKPQAAPESEGASATQAESILADVRMEVTDITIDHAAVEEQVRGHFTVRNVGPEFNIPNGVVDPGYGVFILDADGTVLFRNFGGISGPWKTGYQVTVGFNTRSNHLGQTSEPPFLIPKPGTFILQVLFYRDPERKSTLCGLSTPFAVK